MLSPPDLVLVDLLLPGTDGIDLVAVLREEEETRTRKKGKKGL